MAEDLYKFRKIKQDINPEEVEELEEKYKGNVEIKYKAKYKIKGEKGEKEKTFVKRGLIHCISNNTITIQTMVKIKKKNIFSILSIPYSLGIEIRKIENFK